MSEQRCETCAHWHRSRAAAEYCGPGDCRIRAPLRDADTGEARWPKTEPSDWCGDYRLDPDADAKAAQARADAEKAAARRAKFELNLA